MAYLERDAGRRIYFEDYGSGMDGGQVCEPGILTLMQFVQQGIEWCQLITAAVDYLTRIFLIFQSKRLQVT